MAHTAIGDNNYICSFQTEEAFRSDSEIHHIYNVGRPVFHIDFSDTRYSVKGVSDGLRFLGVPCLSRGHAVITPTVGSPCHVRVAEYIDVPTSLHTGWLPTESPDF